MLAESLTFFVAFITISSISWGDVFLPTWLAMPLIAVWHLNHGKKKSCAFNNEMC